MAPFSVNTMQWGQNAVVLEPQELRNKLEKDALEMLENYRTRPGN